MKLRRLPGVALVCALGMLGCVKQSSSAKARVWSSSTSDDGYAKCPAGTVVGGGHEMAEDRLLPGQIPTVTASRPEGQGWFVRCVDDKGRPAGGCRAWAVCASVLQ